MELTKFFVTKFFVSSRLIFLVSRYHILMRMFTEHNRPLYKSAVTTLLGKPPTEESVRFVVVRLAEETAHRPCPRTDGRIRRREKVSAVYLDERGFFLLMRGTRMP